MPHPIYPPRAAAVVDTAALTRNFQLLRAHAHRSGHPRMIAVVKANAYGHGMGLVVPALLAVGCDFFAVATLEEALHARLLAPRADILILGYTPPRCAPLLAQARLTQAVFSADYAAELSACAQTRPVAVHIKADCGMHRLGFAPDDTERIAAVAALPGLRATGLFTHFPAADTDLAATRYAFSRFLQCKRDLTARGLSLFCHAAATAALLSLPESLLDGVRPGLGLYGASAVPTTLPLCPVLRLQAPVVQIRDLPAGTPVGYGGAFVTQRPTKLGVCPLGYGDGLPRAAEGLSVTAVHKKTTFSVPVVGHICMDYTMVDLTDTPLAVGDTVIFFDDPRPMAAHVGTIPYEILTAVSPRVERVRKEG